MKQAKSQDDSESDRFHLISKVVLGQFSVYDQYVITNLLQKQYIYKMFLKG